MAEMVDIIGNALADEAAEIAVKLLRPQQGEIAGARIAEEQWERPSPSGGRRRRGWGGTIAAKLKLW